MVRSPKTQISSSFRLRKTKQWFFFFLTLFEHKEEACEFFFRLIKIIHLRVRKVCKIFKECFISSRRPRRNMTVQPLFTERFDVKCVNCPDRSVLNKAKVEVRGNGLIHFQTCSEGGGRLELLFLSCELGGCSDGGAEEGECLACGIVSLE